MAPETTAVRRVCGFKTVKCVLLIVNCVYLVRRVEKHCVVCLVHVLL